MIKHIKRLFLEKFGYEAQDTYFAPGRVNIIGEHTDYNGGLVMPFCIDKGIYAAIKTRQDKLINIFSENFSIQGMIQVDLAELPEAMLNNYGDYLVGVIKVLFKHNYDLHQGLDIAISSTLPVGGGLSSSAALTVLLLKVFSDKLKLNLAQLEIVKLAKAVENNYLGVKCGIMDQFVIVFSNRDKALFLNTKTLDFELIPLNLKEYSFVLINSDTSRKLADSKYNQRQTETLQALKILQNFYDIEDLSEITPDFLDEALGKINDDVLKKRVRHVVTENERVKKVKDSLLKNHLHELGDILTEAHYSLKDDYEVSSPLIDDLVEIALKSGASGSRMIGGGFGGSTLNLVLNANLEGFIKEFQTIYQKRYEKPFIYSVVYAKDGIGQID
ncbi:MAG: galactokinase [Candidatus Izemoplasmatales bacterium]|jgi:galactokinase|nr:galactokinase [Candidatus Izemoplasmatales bacterium]